MSFEPLEGVLHHSFPQKCSKTTSSDLFQAAIDTDRLIKVIETFFMLISGDVDLRTSSLFSTYLLKVSHRRQREHLESGSSGTACAQRQKAPGDKLTAPSSCSVFQQQSRSSAHQSVAVRLLVSARVSCVSVMKYILWQTETKRAKTNRGGEDSYGKINFTHHCVWERWEAAAILVCPGAPGVSPRRDTVTC